MFDLLKNSYGNHSRKHIQIAWFLLPFILCYETYMTTGGDRTLYAEHALGGIFHLISAVIGRDLSLPIFFPSFIILCTLVVLGVIRADKTESVKESLLPKPKIIGTMTFESIILCLPIFILSTLMHKQGVLVATAGASSTPIRPIMQAIGAGVFEEFLFRFLLIGFLYWLFKIAFGHNTEKHHGWIFFACTLISSIAFAMVHFNNGNPFAFAKFMFYTLCGAYLGMIYICRGLGIAAGAHITYNLAIVIASS